MQFMYMWFFHSNAYFLQYSHCRAIFGNCEWLWWMHTWIFGFDTWLNIGVLCFSKLVLNYWHSLVDHMERISSTYVLWACWFDITCALMIVTCSSQKVATLFAQFWWFPFHHCLRNTAQHRDSKRWASRWCFSLDTRAGG